jgi:hypothetical protein
VVIVVTLVVNRCSVSLTLSAHAVMTGFVIAPMPEVQDVKLVRHLAGVSQPSSTKEPYRVMLHARPIHFSKFQRIPGSSRPRLWRFVMRFMSLMKVLISTH